MLLLLLLFILIEINFRAKSATLTVILICKRSVANYNVQKPSCKHHNNPHFSFYYYKLSLLCFWIMGEKRLLLPTGNITWQIQNGFPINLHTLFPYLSLLCRHAMNERIEPNQKEGKWMRKNNTCETTREMFVKLVASLWKVYAS